ncbi:MAG TPA: N-acetylmuramoyl-L-alanine amidase [Feifaniaceae bacterium]|nr:N-acetylmuramoyl-L-alanine amidase [Feifaniaceae bacterium]
MRVRMKKTIYALTALLLVFSSCGTAFAVSPLSSASMRLGSSGENVTLLQQNLVELGLYSLEPDGVYGAQTALAVRRLQAQLGLRADGACGPLTIQAFNKAYANAAPAATATPSSVEETKSAQALSPLSGKKIGIDPGHQRKADTALEPVAPGSSRMKQRMSAGGVGVKTKIPEYETNLIIAKKLRTLLEEAGAAVYMLRTEHDVQLSNIERAKAMNAADVDCWIRIHCDSSTDSSVNGVHVLAPSAVSSPEIAESSLRLARLMLKGISKATGAKELSVLVKADQTGFNWSERPVVAVELGYLTNPAEDVRLNRAYYQNDCALGMYEALAAYFS